MMRFASAVSANPDRERAVEDLFGQIRGTLDPADVHLLVFFCSAHFEDELESIVELLRLWSPSAMLLGCTAEGTIGAGRELQRGCSMSALAGVLPGVDIHPFRLTQEQLEAKDAADDWTDPLGVAADTSAVMVALGDPFSFDVLEFLEKINAALPGVPVVGGMASAAEQPGQTRLILGDRVHREGMVGVTLTGNITVRTVVSQGCRPIGQPFVVTKGDRNVIRELGGKPPVVQLNKVFQDLTPKEVALAKQALFVGRVINEYQDAFARGDFLIQNIVGLDPEGGAIAVAAQVRVGSTVQFHVRDAECADEDLRTLLGGVSPGVAETPPAAAMLFDCNGRGIRMWPHEGHDVGILRELCGPIPVAGFFAAGEIGPVGGKNFVHGFTASIALLSPSQS
ncbi:MAG TPA: FIST N-terminal domain-containing protein [Phycisphaerae bacterium]|nr:FIST N-terminal domain-containing protein [Phycisphaerae bacterium]